MSILYSITPIPLQHCYQVKLTFTAISVMQELKLPVWIPGSYMVREFSKQLYDFRAKVKDKPIVIEQISKNSWQLNNLLIDEVVEVEYMVYAYEYGIRTAFLDHNRGYFNPSSLCLMVVAKESTPLQVSFNDLPANWQICSGLNQLNDTTFNALNYAELIDCPFELGCYQRLEFSILGIPHYLVLSGTIPEFDKSRLLADMLKICEYQIKMFKSPIPYTSYTFILNLSGEIYTGLEHRNSTLLMAPYYALPNLAANNNSEYHKLLALTSHEFFHTWNVKRIKPQAFEPYNLDQENYTKLLWWFEGVTSYYDDLVLYRVGIFSRDEYLTQVVKSLNQVYKFNGVNCQTLANSSLTSWIKYYRQDENSPNTIVSYYVKGSLVALCLDLILRSNSTVSLDQVMHELYLQWLANQNKGVAEDSLAFLIKQVSGVDVESFLNTAIETTQMLPYDKLLAEFGLELTIRPAQNHQDNGKFVTVDILIKEPQQFDLDLGARLEKQSLGYLVKNVFSGGSCAKAGIAAGDLIIAINNLKLINLEQQLAFYKAEDSVILSVFRQERLLNITLKLSPSIETIYELKLVDENLLANWL